MVSTSPASEATFILLIHVFNIYKQLTMTDILQDSGKVVIRNNKTLAVQKINQYIH